MAPTPRTRVSTLLGGFVLLAACSTAATTTEPAPDVTPSSTTEATAPGTETTSADSGTEIVVTSGELGENLSDGDGNTLYLFLPDDASGESTCYDTCEATWPPVDEAVAGEGVDASLLGTTTRTDGTVQATYAGWPLYVFAADQAPGDTTGQGVNDVWFVVGADGSALGVGG